MKISLDVIKRYLKSDFIGATILGVIYFVTQPRPGLYPQVLLLIFFILLIIFYFSKKVPGKEVKLALSLGRKLAFWSVFFAVWSLFLPSLGLVKLGGLFMLLSYYSAIFYLVFLVNVVSLFILYWMFSSWSLVIEKNGIIKLSDYKAKIITMLSLVFLKEAILYFGLL